MPLSAISLAEARAEAAACRKLLAEGVDPIEARKADRERAALASPDALVFSQAAADYIACHKGSWKNKKHGQEWENTLATYAYPILGKVDVRDVDTPMVVRVLREGVDVKYAFIERNRHHWPISVLCEVLDVSPSGFHQRRQRIAQDKPRRSGESDDALLAHIKVIHAQVKGEYGWPRMWKELVACGVRVGKERVRKLMAQHGIRARHKRKYIVTTNSNHNLPVAPNLLARNFTATAPNQVWTSDITYCATAEGWVYLAVIIDLFRGQVVGWSMQPHMKAELVTDALRMAWFRRRPDAGVIVHSDRGSQYCSGLFQDTLKAYGMRSSMSRRGDCWDAPTENLWGSLNVARLHGRHFATRRTAMDEIGDWLGFYNSRRLHSTLDYVSPTTFEKNWFAAQQGRAA